MPILANMSTMTVGTFHALSAPAQTEIILQHGEALKYEIHLSIYQPINQLSPTEGRSELRLLTTSIQSFKLLLRELPIVAYLVTAKGGSGVATGR